MAKKGVQKKGFPRYVNYDQYPKRDYTDFDDDDFDGEEDKPKVAS